MPLLIDTTEKAEEVPEISEEKIAELRQVAEQRLAVIQSLKK